MKKKLMFCISVKFILFHFCFLIILNALLYPLTEHRSILKGNAKVNDIVFEYEIIGKGIPVVMIHGFSVDRETMKGCMEPIFVDLKGWKRIYFDLPGMGKTKGTPLVKNSDHILDVLWLRGTG